MSLFHNKKIDTLRSHVNNMDDYLLLDYNLRITEEEAVRLYENAKDDEMKSMYYFLMPEEYQIKYIEDINKFNTFFNSVFLYTKTENVRAAVLERMSVIGSINANNVSDIVEKTNDNNVKSAIIYSVVKNLDRLSIDLEILAADMLDKHKEMFLLDKARPMDSIELNSYFNLVKEIKDSKIKKNVVRNYIAKSGSSMNYLNKSHYFYLILSETLKSLDEDDVRDIVRDLINNPNLNIDQSRAFSFLPYKEIKQMYTNGENINFPAIIDLISYRNKAGIDSGDGLEELVIEYITNLKEPILERLEFVYDNFTEEDRFACIESLIEKHGAEDYKPYLISIFQEIEGNYNFNNYPYIKQAFIEYFNMENRENFDKFVTKFGTKSINYLVSNNIVTLINSEEDIYDEILSLFNKDNTTLNDNVVNTVVNSFLQRQFRIEQAEDYGIFARFESLLLEKNSFTIQEVNSLLNKMMQVVDFDKVLTGKTLDVDALFEWDKDNINFLHSLTNAYISKKREMYVASKKDLAYSSLNIEKYYTKSYVKKQFITKNTGSSILLQVGRASEYCDLTDIEKDFINNFSYEDVWEIKDFKTGKIDRSDSELINKVATLDKILDKMYSARQLTLYVVGEDAKYQYVFDKITDDKVLDILVGIDINSYRDKIKGNELCERLNSLLSKYKIMGWNDSFTALGKACDVIIDDSTAYTLINHFDKIYKKFCQLDEKNRTLTALIDIANVYGGSSKKFATLIGKENFDFICLDPAPNKTSFTKGIRIREIEYYVKKMYEREYITVPSGEKTISLNNNKKIKFSIGDIYDPIALTYGERTESCLRIKGAFEDLFAYCLNDKNGFHIRFDDPETGEFISRVSGLRNGNTVFLNELRNSVSDKYSEDELVECLQKIAMFLVEFTKNDPNPIENVIISNDYAMANEAKFDLGIENRNEAFKNLKFNIANEGNILYTASEDHKSLVPYKFGDEYVSVYRPYNCAVYRGDSQKATEIINRVHMIECLIDGQEFGDISEIEGIDAQKCIYGHGWIVYLDSKGKMHEMILSKFKKDKQLMKLIEESKKKCFGGKADEEDRQNTRV